MDGYRTIEAPARDEFIERRSRFIGHIAPVEDFHPGLFGIRRGLHGVVCQNTQAPDKIPYIHIYSRYGIKHFQTALHSFFTHNGEFV